MEQFMSFYMASHKKKKKFPFSIFGFAALVEITALVIYFWQSDLNIDTFFTTGPDQEMKNILGFSLIIYSFLIYFLSLGITGEINGRFKIPLYLTQLFFFIMLALCGYFISEPIFEHLITYTLLLGVFYFLTLTIYFLFQRRAYSRYYSYFIMTITSFPLLSFMLGTYLFLIQGKSGFTSEYFSFDNITIYALLFTMLLYTIVNSIYLLYINRRVY